MMRWNTGLAQGNTETNELGYKSGLKRVLAFSECRTLPDFASIKTAANDAKGKDGAFEIIEQFEPIVSRIVEKRSEAPNFDRQLLTDEINTGKRGIIDLIAEYKPDSNVPLAAYINKYLPARSIEASQRVLG